MHSNRICHEREMQRTTRIHREKLRHMKPTSKTNSRCGLDNSAPPKFKHLELRLKKHQMEDDLKQKIQHENCLLISKMYSIMKSERPTGAVEFQPGIRLSKDHTPLVDCYNDRKNIDPSRAGNIAVRKRDFMRVMHENVAILKRIQAGKPTYSVGAWEADSNRKEKLAASLNKSRWHVNGYLNLQKPGKSQSKTSKSSRHKSKLRKPTPQQSGSQSARLPSAPTPTKPVSNNNYRNKGRVLSNRSGAALGEGVLLHVAVVTAVDTASMPSLMRQFAGMVEAAVKTKATGDTGMVHYHSLDSNRLLYISLGSSAHMIATQKSISVHARACAMSALGMTKHWQGTVFGAVSTPLQQIFERENEGKKISLDVNPTPAAGYPAVVPDGVFAFEDGAEDTDLLLHIAVATLKDPRFMDSTLNIFRDISEQAKQQSQPLHQYHILDSHTILYVCVSSSATAAAIERRMQEEGSVDRFSLFASGEAEGDSLSDGDSLVRWKGKIFGGISPEYKSVLSKSSERLGYSVVNDVNPVPIVGFGSTFGRWMAAAKE